MVPQAEALADGLMHQAAWLAWVMGAGLCAVLSTNPFYLLPLFAVAWVVYASCRRPGATTRSFRLFVIFGVLTIITRTALVFLNPIVDAPVTTAAFVTAALEGLRLAVLLALFGAFNAVTDPFRVLRLAPRRWHEPALAAALALSIAPRTIAAAGRVREAQRLRGIEVARWRSLPALAVPVLENGMDDAMALAESMDARGHGRGRRTAYRPERWTPSAFVTVGATLVAAGVFVAAAFGDHGALGPSFFPLRWPDASTGLVAAALVLSVPAFVVPPQERPA
jgi:energy-coupling factor transport system permease protein